MLFLLWSCVISPFLIGTIPAHFLKEEYGKNPVFRYILGWMCMWAVFFVICVPMDIKGLPFHLCTNFYNGILICGNVAGAFLFIQEIRKQKISFSIHRNQWSLLIPILIIFLQGIFYLRYMPTYYLMGDDQTYLTVSTTTLYTDTMNQYDPLTGQYMGIENAMGKYLYTSHLFWVSWLSKMTAIPVSILCRTVFQIMFLYAAYLVYYLFGKIFYGSNTKKISLFLCFLVLINTFSAFSLYSMAFRLLVCLWQGKALMATIILPFLFLLLWIDSRKNTLTWADYVSLIVTCLAGCSMSLMAIGLEGIMVAAFFLLKVGRQLLRKRRERRMQNV